MARRVCSMLCAHPKACESLGVRGQGRGSRGMERKAGREADEVLEGLAHICVSGQSPLGVLKGALHPPDRLQPRRRQAQRWA